MGPATMPQLSKMAGRNRRTSLSGMMGEADVAVQTAMAQQGTTQVQAQDKDAIARDYQQMKAEQAAKEAVKAEHDLMKQAILSGTDPRQSAAAADLEKRLNEVYHEMDEQKKKMRVTDDDAWWVNVTEKGELGNRCYIPRQTEWHQPRFTGNPRHVDAQAMAEAQHPLDPPMCNTRLQDTVVNEWKTQKGMMASKEKDDKKLELIELEEKGFLTDDAFHVAISKLGEAALLQQEGKCTEARGCVEHAIKILQRVHGFDSTQYQKAMWMHGNLCEAQSDYFGAKQSFIKALNVARGHARRLHPRSTCPTKDVTLIEKCIARVDRRVDKRWADAKQRERQDMQAHRAMKAAGFARGYV